ncbi:hypothetical protein D3C78_1837870 [compost metagenome]
MIASSTFWIVPVASFAIPVCSAFASIPIALSPSWNLFGCWVAMASSRIMALVAVPAVSAVLPMVRNVDPRAAASL